MTTQPVFVDALRRGIVEADVDVRGWSDGWAAPLSFINAPNGFGEEIWHLVQTEAVIAWRTAGAPVFSELPSSAGRSTSGQRHSVNLQVPGMPQRFRAAGSVRFCHIFITEPLLRRVAEGLDRPALSPATLRDDLVMFDDRELRSGLERYEERSIDRVRPATRLELEARALLIVEHLITTHHGGRSRQPARGGLAGWQLKRACEAMEARLDASPGLDDLAAIAGCTASHFSRAFKQSTGVAPFRWLAERRMDKAKALLGEGRLSLAEIGQAVGFAAQPQFTSAFKRSTGTTPGRWRRERRE